MTSRTTYWLVTLILFIHVSVYAQNEITETIDEAKQLYLEKNLSESISSLSRALELMNVELLAQLESVFPEPLNSWRIEAPASRINKTAYSTGLISTCKYFKKGGGPSVEIEIQTNAPRIANIKMAFVNPSLINQMGTGAKISTFAERTCIERYDSVDQFAELIFVPTSSVLITIRGFEMKDTSIIAQYAEKVKWDSLASLFP